MSEWKECRLGDVADRIAIGPFGSNIKISTFVNEGIPVISGTHLRGIRLEDKEYNFITVEHANKLQSANVYRGDVIFTHAGNIGQVAFIPNNSEYERYIISQRQFYLRCRKDVLTPEYLTYYFKSAEGQYKLLANANQTGVPSLAQPVSYLKTIDILLPPLPEQRAIAGVLSSLDDKIDLLHRQNKTLEGMAEALWRKMFVEEADPGWKKGKLGDIAEINPLRSIKQGTVATYLDMSNMPTDGPFPKDWIQREFSSGTKFKNGDTIIARITPCLENGKTAYVNFLGDQEIGWGSTEYIMLAPKLGYCAEWYYFLARNDDFRDFAIQNMTGTSGRQRVSGNSVGQYEIAIPPMSISDKFKAFADPVMEHIKYNSIQIRTLSRLRDTLLPKLMSGEVRVKV